jgi:hypothetical protein
MFNSDIFANRPAAGVVGRIFISTDTYEFYRDTGYSWDLIGGSGTGTVTGSGTIGTLPIWTGSSVLGDSTLLEGATKFTTTKDFQADGYYLTGMTGGSGALYWTSDRVTLANYNVGGIVHIEVNGGVASTIFGTDLSLTNNGYISAIPSLTAANNASSVAIYGQNSLGIAAGFSSNNIGAIYGAIAGVNLQTFAGSATFAQANVASGSLGVNSIDFSSAGSTITMTQAAGIRAMAGNIAQVQYQGTNSGTITHAAIQQNLGFYRPSSATGILTITNAYSHLINALDDYGAGFTFTNRWGIYQAGASDKNYFAANMLLGSTTDNGERLQVNGSGYFSSIASNDYVGATLLNTNNNASIATSSSLKIGFTSTVGTHFATLKLTESSVNDNSGDLTISLPYGGIESTKLTLTGLGNLGIGISPFGRLTSAESVNNATANVLYLSNPSQTGVTSAAINFVNADAVIKSSIIAAVYGNDYMSFNVNSNTERMRISAAGNLLIGTTTDAGFKLDVNGAGRITGTNPTFVINRQSSGTYPKITFSESGTDYGYIQANAASGILRYDIGPSAGWGGIHAFFTDQSEKLRIAANGNVLINTTTDAGQKLYLNGSLRIDGQTAGTAGGSSGQHLIINCDGTTYKIALLNN